MRIIKYWLNLQNIKNNNCILKTLNLVIRNEVQNNLKIRLVGQPKLSIY